MSTDTTIECDACGKTLDPRGRGHVKNGFLDFSYVTGWSERVYDHLDLCDNCVSVVANVIKKLKNGS